MANAPSHAPNAATKMVTIYDAEGNPHTASRLNALDLIRGGGYFWKNDDVNKPRPEADGPANPSEKTQTIYDADGKPYELDTANARDMIATGNYFWQDPTGTAQEEALNNVIDAAEKVAAAEEKVAASEAALNEESSATAEDDESAPASTADPDVDPNTETLAAQAERVTGSDDVIAYLEGFAPERLRDMAMERYGEKLHHRASKDTIITKMVELEDARTVGDDQADA